MFFLVCFMARSPGLESGRSVPAGRLTHTRLKSAVGSYWTSWSWKGKRFTGYIGGVRRQLVSQLKSRPLFPPAWFVQSSLLSSILGELPAEKGVLKVKGQLTYAAQQPWVFPGTIRSNILFGKEMDPKKYGRVLKACALKRVSSSLRRVNS